MSLPTTVNKILQSIAPDTRSETKHKASDDDGDDSITTTKQLGTPNQHQLNNNLYSLTIPEEITQMYCNFGLIYYLHSTQWALKFPHVVMSWDNPHQRVLLRSTSPHHVPRSIVCYDDLCIDDTSHEDVLMVLHWFELILRNHQLMDKWCKQAYKNVYTQYNNTKHTTHQRESLHYDQDNSSPDQTPQNNKASNQHHRQNSSRNIIDIEDITTTPQEAVINNPNQSLFDNFLNLYESKNNVFTHHSEKTTINPTDTPSTIPQQQEHHGTSQDETNHPRQSAITTNATNLEQQQWQKYFNPKYLPHNDETRCNGVLPQDQVITDNVPQQNQQHLQQTMHSITLKLNNNLLGPQKGFLPLMQQLSGATLTVTQTPTTTHRVVEKTKPVGAEKQPTLPTTPSAAAKPQPKPTTSSHSSCNHFFIEALGTLEQVNTCLALFQQLQYIMFHGQTIIHHCNQLAKPKQRPSNNNNNNENKKHMSYKSQLKLILPHHILAKQGILHKHPWILPLVEFRHQVLISRKTFEVYAQCPEDAELCQQSINTILSTYHHDLVEEWEVEKGEQQKKQLHNQQYQRQQHQIKLKERQQHVLSSDDTLSVNKADTLQDASSPTNDNTNNNNNTKIIDDNVYYVDYGDDLDDYKDILGTTTDKEKMNEEQPISQPQPQSTQDQTNTPHQSPHQLLAHSPPQPIHPTHIITLLWGADFFTIDLNPKQFIKQTAQQKQKQQNQQQLQAQEQQTQYLQDRSDQPLLTCHNKETNLQVLKKEKMNDISQIPESYQLYLQLKEKAMLTHVKNFSNLPIFAPPPPHIAQHTTPDALPQQYRQQQQQQHRGSRVYYYYDVSFNESLYTKIIGHRLSYLAAIASFTGVHIIVSPLQSVFNRYINTQLAHQHKEVMDDSPNDVKQQPIKNTNTSAQKHNKKAMKSTNTTAIQKIASNNNKMTGCAAYIDDYDYKNQSRHQQGGVRDDDNNNDGDATINEDKKYHIKQQYHKVLRLVGNSYQLYKAFQLLNHLLLEDDTTTMMTSRALIQYQEKHSTKSKTRVNIVSHHHHHEDGGFDESEEGSEKRNMSDIFLTPTLLDQPLKLATIIQDHTAYQQQQHMQSQHQQAQKTKSTKAQPTAETTKTPQTTATTTTTPKTEAQAPTSPPAKSKRDKFAAQQAVLNQYSRFQQQTISKNQLVFAFGANFIHLLKLIELHTHCFFKIHTTHYVLYYIDYNTYYQTCVVKESPEQNKCGDDEDDNNKKPDHLSLLSNIHEQHKFITSAQSLLHFCFDQGSTYRHDHPNCNGDEVFKFCFDKLCEKLKINLNILFLPSGSQHDAGQTATTTHNKSLLPYIITHTTTELTTAMKDDAPNTTTTTTTTTTPPTPHVIKQKKKHLYLHLSSTPNKYDVYQYKLSNLLKNNKFMAKFELSYQFFYISQYNYTYTQHKEHTTPNSKQKYDLYVDIYYTLPEGEKKERKNNNHKNQSQLQQPHPITSTTDALNTTNIGNLKTLFETWIGQIDVSLLNK